MKFLCTSCGAPCTEANEAREDTPEDDASFASDSPWNPEDSSGDASSHHSEPSQASDPGRPVPTLASDSMNEAALPFDPAGAYSKDATAQRLDQEVSDAAGLEPFTAAKPDEPHPPLDNPEGTLLKQDGKVYHVRNLATIQRWIVARFRTW